MNKPSEYPIAPDKSRILPVAWDLVVDLSFDITLPIISLVWFQSWSQDLLWFFNICPYLTCPKKANWFDVGSSSILILGWRIRFFQMSSDIFLSEKKLKKRHQALKKSFYGFFSF